MIYIFIHLFLDLHSRKEEIEEEIQTLLRRAARDLGLETGKTIKIDFTDQHKYFFRVTLKEEPVLRDAKKYRIIDTVKGGVRFTVEQLDDLNSEYVQVTNNYQDTQKNVVEEILNIAGKLLLRKQYCFINVLMYISFLSWLREYSDEYE